MCVSYINTCVYVERKREEEEERGVVEEGPPLQVRAGSGRSRNGTFHRSSFPESSHPTTPAALTKPRNIPCGHKTISNG